MEQLWALTANISAIGVLVLGMYKNWIISKGAKYLRRFYWLNITSATLNLLVNGLIIVRDPALWGVISFQIALIWAIIMSVKGLMYGEIPSRKYLD